jgi:hypothetical protein
MITSATIRSLTPQLERGNMATRAGGRTSGGTRVAPTRNVDFEHLDIDALRAYRKTITDEESRVSYWRRIIQARLDLLRADDRDAGRLERLDSALGAAQGTSRRQALITLMPADDVPPIPALDTLWARQVDPNDAVGVAALERELAFAELQLSAYRTALHERISLATGELIARYRDEPTLCLRALPLKERRAALSVS